MPQGNERSLPKGARFVLVMLFQNEATFKLRASLTNMRSVIGGQPNLRLFVGYLHCGHVTDVVFWVVIIGNQAMRFSCLPRKQSAANYERQSQKRKVVNIGMALEDVTQAICGEVDVWGFEAERCRNVVRQLANPNWIAMAANESINVFQN